MRTRRSFLHPARELLRRSLLAAGRRTQPMRPGSPTRRLGLVRRCPTAGPAPTGAIGRTEVAYFKMVNDMGGINRRKVNLISLDDGYSPPQTVEQTRRLVEQQQVAFIFGSVGTAQNAAIRSYLNDHK